MMPARPRILHRSMWTLLAFAVATASWSTATAAQRRNNRGGGETGGDAVARTNAGRTETPTLPGTPSFAEFDIVVNRNIFDPTRSIRRPPQERAERPQGPTEQIKLTGVLVDGDRAFALFEGSRPEWNTMCPEGEKIADFIVETVVPYGIRLRAGEETLDLPVGYALTRQGDSPWRDAPFDVAYPTRTANPMLPTRTNRSALADQLRTMMEGMRGGRGGRGGQMDLRSMFLQLQNQPNQQNQRGGNNDRGGRGGNFGGFFPGGTPGEAPAPAPTATPSGRSPEEIRREMEARRLRESGQQPPSDQPSGESRNENTNREPEPNPNRP